MVAKARSDRHLLRGTWRSVGPFALLAATLTIVSSGCTGESAGHSAVKQGKALVGAVEQTQGVYGYPDPELGQEYWFAFPLTTNRNRQSVSIQSFSLRNVDGGIKVLGYTTVNVEAGGLNGDVPTFWDTSKPFPPDPPGKDLRESKYRAKVPFRINAGETSPVVGIARIRLKNEEALRKTRSGDLKLSGCAFRYKQGSVLYQQVLSCEFHFGQL